MAAFKDISHQRFEATLCFRSMRETPEPSRSHQDLLAVRMRLRNWLWVRLASFVAQAQTACGHKLNGSSASNGFMRGTIRFLIRTRKCGVNRVGEVV
jgi:hypothetical protein